LNPAPLRIEVVYAGATRAHIKSLVVAPGASVADALRMAALGPEFSGMDLTHSTVGIFGKVTRMDQILEDGDRVEIYRPLAADPKLARRARAKQARTSARNA
jgi:putative ubiquitin-RnfH superfamily antitoxin RatB of RatAB toxin-antitoxin module